MEAEVVEPDGPTFQVICTPTPKGTSWGTIASEVWCLRCTEGSVYLPGVTSGELIDLYSVSEDRDTLCCR